jgi:hypothetical protein
LLVFVALSGRARADYDRAAVGTCTTLAHFPTIQLAVNSVYAGSTVEVCPGTYPEQVVINKNLTLQGIVGSGEDAAVILPPVGGLVANATDLDSGNAIAAQLLVTSGTVSIVNLTVDGTGNGITGCVPSSPDVQGILFQNASGTLNHVAVRNQVPGGTLGVCLSGGESIFVQSSTGSSTVTVENSSVHNYNANGITGNGAGTTLTVSSSYVQGSGVVSGGAVQNGIQLGYGAKGKINLDTVIDNVTVGGPPYAADILLFDAAESAGITISSNVVGNSQIPIALETDGDNGGGNLGDGVSVTSNKVFGATGDAIDVCTNSNKVTSNTIYNNGNSGVHLDASCGASYGGASGTNNVATGNSIVESTCAAILDDSGGGGGNTYTGETDFTVPFLIAYSTGSCPFVAGELHAKTKPKLRFSPRK